MPCFKMTRCGSRLFSIKTQRWSARLGGVKNQLRWGETLKSCEFGGSAGEKRHVDVVFSRYPVAQWLYIYIYLGILRGIGFKQEFLLYK